MGVPSEYIVDKVVSPKNNKNNLITDVKVDDVDVFCCEEEGLAGDEDSDNDDPPY